MAGNLLLDANAVIAFIGLDAAIAAKVTPARVFVPTIVLGELFFGAEKSSRVAENMDRLNRFASRSTILEVDFATAIEYGKVKNELRLRGSPIPANDIWIAAIARRHAITLVTRDAHFSVVN